MDTTSGRMSLWGHLIQPLLQWLSTVFPERQKNIPSLVPEVDPIVPAEHSRSSIIAPSCSKAHVNHHHFVPFPELDLHHLPDRWRRQHVLQDIRDIGRRVVKLLVRRKSPDRFPNNPEKKKLMKYGHHGTGFVTCDSDGQLVVHTSKHVVLDPHEASNTVVIFFCDAEGAEGVKCKGSSRHFRSVWSMDYSCFTLEQPVPQEVLGRVQTVSERTFSWRVFSLSRLLYRQARDVDVVIVSHPHGAAKQVSVGTMSRRHNMSIALYSATTCPGSSGAPVIRLSDDYMHYVAAGQFVHHGYDGFDNETATAIGSLRPPLTLPYYRLLDSGRIRQVVALLYEPVSYWALYLTDFLELEGILFNCTDNFCYFLTFYGYFLGWQDPWTLKAFWGFLCVILCQEVVYATRGFRYVVLHLLHLAQSLAMHWVTWLACYLVPGDCQSLVWLAPLWLAVLICSRHWSLSRWLGCDLFHAFLKCKI